jgi:DNA-binding beta-propeller fold protein YncE
VALRDRDSVLGVEVTDPETMTFEPTVTLEVPTDPVGLAVTPGGSQLLVVSGWASELSVFDVATRAETLRVALPREPRGVAVSPDGKHAYVSHATVAQISRVALDLERPQPVGLALGGEDFHQESVGILGSLAALDVQLIGSLSTANGPLRDETIDVRETPSPDAVPPRGAVDFRGGGGRGNGVIGLGHTGVPLGTTARARRVGRDAVQGFAMAITAEELFVPEVLVHRGSVMTGGYGTSESFPAHQPALAQLRLDEDEPQLRVMNRTFAASSARNGFAGGASKAGCLLPRAVAVDEKGGTVFVACLGSDEVLAYARDEEPLATSLRGAWKVPPGPTGLVVDPRGGQLVVWSSFASAVSRLPLSAPHVAADEATARVAVLRRKAVAPVRTRRLEPLEGGVTLSEAARRGRLLFHGAGDARISADGRACASCHPDGRDDGLTWPTPNGARQTPMLAGRLLDSTKPFGWQGDAASIEAHLTQTLARLGGKGLGDDAKADLVAYLREMGTPSRPAPEPDGDVVAKGRALFHADTVGCATCHTDEGVGSDGARHDVGTGQAVETPSLRFVAGTGPYFHDGRYETLSQLLRETQGVMGWATNLAPEDLSALEAYLSTL